MGSIPIGSFTMTQIQYNKVVSLRNNGYTIVARGTGYVILESENGGLVTVFEDGKVESICEPS